MPASPPCLPRLGAPACILSAGYTLPPYPPWTTPHAHNKHTCTRAWARAWARAHLLTHTTHTYTPASHPMPTPPGGAVHQRPQPAAAVPQRGVCVPQPPQRVRRPVPLAAVVLAADVPNAAGAGGGAAAAWAGRGVQRGRAGGSSHSGAAAASAGRATATAAAGAFCATATAHAAGASASAAAGRTVCAAAAAKADRAGPAAARPAPCGARGAQLFLLGRDTGQQAVRAAFGGQLSGLDWHVVCWAGKQSKAGEHGTGAIQHV